MGQHVSPRLRTLLPSPRFGFEGVRVSSEHATPKYTALEH